MEPDDTHADGAPIFDADHFETPTEFSHAIQCGRLPLPCWLRIGRTSMKVTEESAADMGRGILLASLLTTYHAEG